jgi:hypothetical protein
MECTQYPCLTPGDVDLIATVLGILILGFVLFGLLARHMERL